MAQAEFSGFFEVERWSDKMADGRYVLLDPTTANQFDPNNPPAWIEQDPRLHAGLEYQRAHGDRLDLTITYVRHDQASDYGDLAEGWFERQVAAAHYYGNEGSGHITGKLGRDVLMARHILGVMPETARDMQVFLQVARDAGLDKNGTYLRECRAIAMAGAGLTAFSYDVAKDGRPVERALSSAKQQIADLPISEKSVLAGVAFGMLREWIGVAKTGLTVSDGERSRQRRVSVLETIGASHRDYTRKFAVTGVNAHDIVVAPHLWSQARQLIAVIPEIYRTGIVEPQWMNLLARHHTAVKESQHEGERP